MYAGDTIHGKTGQIYLLLKPLGTPGLFGQAFLCRRTTDGTEAVLKTLRSDHSADEQNRFFQEARTLEKVAQVEDRAGVHYAVRLLDESPPDQPEPFIVLERAIGLNVVEDLISPVQDWLYAPLDERLALSIAWEFAQALQHVHQAGICYDDMKLDNLFWNPEQPASPLRIIDWNVTSSVAERGGIAGDWVRFGARLYELRTGTGIGVTRDGLVLGQGPGGPIWERLPEGIRAIIEQALSGRYVDDTILLRDLQREKEQALLGWPELLDRATSADGAEQVIEVLAPVSRAEQQLLALPADDSQRELQLARCAELRERAEARRGRSSTKILERGRQSLAGNEAKLAVERFQKAYADTRSLDPRPRRWLWLAQLAVEQADLYRLVRKDLEQAVEALDTENLRAALKGLTLAQRAAPDLPVVQWLRAEAEVVKAQASNDLDAAIEWAATWNGLLEQYPDLKRQYALLREQRDIQIKRHTADQHEQHLLQEIERQAAQATAAEMSLRQIQQQSAEHQARQPLHLLNPIDHDLALEQIELELQQVAVATRYYTSALHNLAQLLTNGCTPSVRALAEQKRTQYSAARHRLQQQQQGLTLYSTAIMPARHPDLRQRQQALAAYTAARRALPDLVGGVLATLPEQCERMAQDALTVVRSEQSNLLAEVEAAIQALQRLEQDGIEQIDDSGVTLAQRSAQLRERQRALRNRDVDGHVQRRMDEAARLLADAQATLDVERCRMAQAVLHSDTLQEVAAQLSPEMTARLDSARQEVDQIQQQLAEIAVIRSEIEQLKTADLPRACQFAQRLAARYPEIAVLADERAQLEDLLYQRFETTAMQLVSGAEAVRQQIEQTPHRYGMAPTISELRQHAQELAQRRYALDSFSPLPAARQQPLLEQADAALAGMHTALTAWEQGYSQYREQLRQGLAHAVHALQHGSPEHARQLLAQMQPLLPPPRAASDVDELTAMFHMLHGQLGIWDGLYQQLACWETALSADPPQARYGELVALTEGTNPFTPYLVDPEQAEYLDRRFATLREHATQLRMQLNKALSTAQQTHSTDRARAQAALAWILERTPDYPEAAELQAALTAEAQRQEAARSFNEISWALTNDQQDQLRAMIERLRAIDPSAAEQASARIARTYQEKAALLLDRDDLDAAGLSTAYGWIDTARSFSLVGLEEALAQYHAATALLTAREGLRNAQKGQPSTWANLERQIGYAIKRAHEYGPSSDLAAAAASLQTRWRRAYADHWLTMARQQLSRQEYIDAHESVQEAQKLQVLQYADQIHQLEDDIQAHASRRTQIRLELEAQLSAIPPLLASNLDQIYPQLLRCIQQSASYIEGDPLLQQIADLHRRYAAAWREAEPDSDDLTQWRQYLDRARGLPQLDADVRSLSKKIEIQEVYEQTKQLVAQVLSELSQITVQAPRISDPQTLDRARWRLEASGAQQDHQGQALLEQLARLAALCQNLLRLPKLFGLASDAFNQGYDEAKAALNEVGIAEIVPAVLRYLEAARELYKQSRAAASPMLPSAVPAN